MTDRDTEITELIQKKKDGNLSSEERDHLIELLTKHKAEKNLPAGIAVAIGIVLANLIVKRNEENNKC